MHGTLAGDGQEGKGQVEPDRARLQENACIFCKEEHRLYSFPVGISRSEKPIGHRL